VLDVFVTGTGARVGKTHLAVQLARRSRERSEKPGFLKAVQSGHGDDARTVAAAVPGTVCATVYRYVAPLAPAVAARLEHAPAPSLEHLVEATEELRAATSGVIVEGGDGLLTPLNDEASFADLVALLDLPLLIVTVPEPASINHVALTLDAARRRRLAVAGVVVNRCGSRPGLAERTTRSELGRLATVVESLPLDEPVPAERTPGG
jgi:dethiobiotin synthetase